MVVPEVAPVTSQEYVPSWVAKVGWKFGGESGGKVGKKKCLAVNTESMKAQCGIQAVTREMPTVCQALF